MLCTIGVTSYWHLFIGSSKARCQSHLHRRLSHHRSQQPTFSFSAAHRLAAALAATVISTRSTSATATFTATAASTAHSTAAAVTRPPESLCARPFTANLASQSSRRLSRLRASCVVCTIAWLRRQHCMYFMRILQGAVPPSPKAAFRDAIPKT